MLVPSQVSSDPHPINGALSEDGRVAGATVLITGGTGSFGSTMARRLLQRDVAQVRVLSRDEAKQDDMRRAVADRRCRFYVGDVRDHAGVVTDLSLIHI